MTVFFEKSRLDSSIEWLSKGKKGQKVSITVKHQSFNPLFVFLVFA